MTAGHHTVLGMFFLIVGSCVGSFLNVCVYRIPRSMSLLRPRSHCPLCMGFIRGRDNVPVLGWLLLRGRCRHCRGSIAPRYMAVELTVGLVFAGVYLAAAGLARGDLWELAGAWAVCAGLLVVWTMVSLGVVAVLMAFDHGWRLPLRGGRARHRGAGPGADPV